MSHQFYCSLKKKNDLSGTFNFFLDALFPRWQRPDSIRSTKYHELSINAIVSMIEKRQKELEGERAELKDLPAKV
jgi:hypothetical protein